MASRQDRRSAMSRASMRSLSSVSMTDLISRESCNSSERENLFSRQSRSEHKMPNDLPYDRPITLNYFEQPPHEASILRSQNLVKKSHANLHLCKSSGGMHPREIQQKPASNQYDLTEDETSRELTKCESSRKIINDLREAGLVAGKSSVAFQISFQDRSFNMRKPPRELPKLGTVVNAEQLYELPCVRESLSFDAFQRKLRIAEERREAHIQRIMERAKLAEQKRERVLERLMNRQTEKQHKYETRMAKVERNRRRWMQKKRKLEEKNRKKTIINPRKEYVSGKKNASGVGSSCDVELSSPNVINDLERKLSEVHIPRPGTYVLEKGEDKNDDRDNDLY